MKPSPAGLYHPAVASLANAVKAPPRPKARSPIVIGLRLTTWAAAGTTGKIINKRSSKQEVTYCMVPSRLDRNIGNLYCPESKRPQLSDFM